MEEVDAQMSYLADALAHLYDAVGAALPGILAGLVIIVGFFLLALAFRVLFRQLAKRVDQDRRPLLALASETVRYAVIAVGLVTGLGTMGVDVSALVAGLGLAGFGLGFALRDALSNLLAGVLILLYRPFGYGDAITTGGNAGTVVAINFRYTELRAEDGDAILVPNGSMLSNSVRVQRTAPDPDAIIDSESN